MKRIGSGTFLVMLFVGVVTAVLAAAGAAAAVFPDEIRGTVTFNGCVADPAQVRVRAVPLGVQSDDGPVFPAGRSTVRVARITATADPHVLSFSIRGLAPRTPYQIGITKPPAGCGKMFWRGPERGLALTGTRPVKIEGFAAQTQLELYSSETGRFVGADELEFTDPALATRRLRWKSLLSGVTGGELQLSTEPFPREGSFRTCAEPATGVFYRAAVPAAARGQWRALDPVDFATLLTPAGRGGLARVPGLTPISEATHGLLLLGAPVYMRVVPTIGGAPTCDTKRHGVAGWVVASKRPRGDFELPGPPTEAPLLMAMTGQSYVPPYLGGDGQGHPALGEVAYRVTMPHTVPPVHPSKMTVNQYLGYGLTDPMGMMLLSCNAATPGQTLLPGMWFYYVPMGTSDSSDFLSDFTSALGGLATAAWSGLGAFADFMAEMTEQIKTSLAKAVVNVATVVPGVSAACGGLQSVTGKSCEDVVKTGMEYGLASMGLPPSLPNWEQLQDQGIEYLAAEVATQIGDPTGLSQQFTEQMLHDMVDSTLDRVSMARPGLGANIRWLSPYLGYDPAVWTIAAFKTDPAYVPQSTYIRVNAGSALYQPVNVHVPERWPPGGALRIPVVLQPSTEGIPAPRCRRDVFGTISCQPIWWSKSPVCEWLGPIGGGSYGWVKTDCAYWNWADIYYRDAWVLQKLFLNGCTTLGAYTASNTGGLWLPNPNPPFTDAARLQTLLPATWDFGLYLDPVCP